MHVSGQVQSWGGAKDGIVPDAVLMDVWQEDILPIKCPEGLRNKGFEGESFPL